MPRCVAVCVWQVREEWDEDTGRSAFTLPCPADEVVLSRWRCVRGDGEIIEKIVSKQEMLDRRHSSTHWVSGHDRCAFHCLLCLS